MYIGAAAADIDVDYYSCAHRIYEVINTFKLYSSSPPKEPNFSF